MRHLLYYLFAAFLPISSPAQEKDQPIGISSLSINIQADLFVATTVMNIEFYNPNEKTLDGEYNFSLNAGQVITGFSLDINNMMREGVITDKQKARVAYENTIRRQIDPGLLELTTGNSYKVRIYPMPAKGARSIKITIVEQMVIKENALWYHLPMDIASSVKQFDLVIATKDIKEMPVANDGLIQHMRFQKTNFSFSLDHSEKNSELKKPLSFKIPLPSVNAVTCAGKKKDSIPFALHVRPSKQENTTLSFSSATVFWDVSASSSKRDIKTEIRFLEKVIAQQNIINVRVVSFSNAIYASKAFLGRSGINSIGRYLQRLVFDGGTQLGNLDCNHFDSEVYFLFSDGLSNFGNDKIKTNGKPVFSINSSPAANHSGLKILAGKTGGRYVDLYGMDADKAASAFNIIQEKLLQVQSGGKKVTISNSLPMVFDEWLTVIGRLGIHEDNNLLFSFGDAGRIIKTETIHLDTTRNCDITGLEALNMLQQYEKLVREENEQAIMSFGRQNKIVTAYTSFIVLDNLQDYIQYGIEPPADLQDQYQKMIYVVKEREEQKKKEDANAVLNNLGKTVSLYNERISWWSKEEKQISLQVVEQKEQELVGRANKNSRPVVDNPVDPSPAGDFKFGNSALGEVVVVGYGSQSRRDITGSATVVQGYQLSNGALNVPQALEGRVAGLNVVQNNSQPGAAARIFIRGAGALGHGREPLYVLDGVIVDGEWASTININDVESISVLKDIQAAILYGSRAANGAIVITTKRGFRNTPQYRQGVARYQDLEDVDYLAELKEADTDEIYDRYLQMKDSLGKEPAFYFDVAQLMFESGDKQKALRILSNLAEIDNENHQLLRAMGYVLETWAMYEEAIAVYQKVLRIKEEEPQSYRDLALAYEKKGDHQMAVNILYEALVKNWFQYEERYRGLKSLLLNEMNAIIQLNNHLVDLSKINEGIIKPLPVDLRIVIDWNKDETDIDLHIIEPGGEECDYQHKLTASGGRLSEDFTQGYGPEEYQVKQAKKGKYLIRVNYFGDRYQKQQVPSFIKITVYKNFGKPNQTMSVQNLVMDNQQGMVEIAEVKW